MVEFVYGSENRVLQEYISIFKKLMDNLLHFKYIIESTMELSQEISSFIDEIKEKACDGDWEMTYHRRLEVGTEIVTLKDKTYGRIVEIYSPSGIGISIWVYLGGEKRRIIKNDSKQRFPVIDHNTTLMYIPNGPQSLLVQQFLDTVVEWELVNYCLCTDYGEGFTLMSIDCKNVMLLGSEQLLFFDSEKNCIEMDAPKTLDEMLKIIAKPQQ